MRVNWREYSVLSMKRLVLLFIATLAAGAAIAHARESHPTLAIGAPAPNFELPGVDGKIHRLSDYDSAKVLAVVLRAITALSRSSMKIASKNLPRIIEAEVLRS